MAEWVQNNRLIDRTGRTDWSQIARQLTQQTVADYISTSVKYLDENIAPVSQHSDSHCAYVPILEMTAGVYMCHIRHAEIFRKLHRKWTAERRQRIAKVCTATESNVFEQYTPF